MATRTEPARREAEAAAISACLRGLGHSVAASTLLDSARMAEGEGYGQPWPLALDRHGFAADVVEDVATATLAPDLFPCVRLGPGEPAVMPRPLPAAGTATLLFVRPRLDRAAATIPTSWSALLAAWRPTVIRAGVAGVLANMLALAAPIFSAQVYDRVLPHGVLDSLLVMAGMFLLASLFEQVFRRLRALFVEDALHAGNVGLAVDMHRRVLETRFDGAVAPSGHLMRLLQDYDSIRDGFGAAAVSLFADLPFMALFLLGLFLCDPLVAVAVLALNGAVTVGTLVAIRRQRLLHRELSRAATLRAQAAQESFLDPEAARRVGATAYLQARFRQGTVLYAAATRAIRALSATRGNLSMLAQNFSILLAVGIGAWHAVEGGSSAGVVLAATMLATRFTGAVMQLVSAVPQALQALSSLEALRAVTDRPVERPTGAAFVHRPIAAGEIVLDAVTARYPGQAQPAVVDISLGVPAGGRLAIIGPSGSGKTTLEKVVTGIIRPETGRVMLDGVDVAAIEPADLRRHLAVCPQAPPLFAGTLRTNLSFDGQVGDEAMMRMLGALGREGILPVGMGLDFEVADGGRNLSGGQRQLIALARTLLRGAAVTILDEPTSGMDEATERRVIETIHQVLADRTLIVISHRAAVLNLAPRIAVLNRGRLLRIATPGELAQTRPGGR
ncbi:MAG: peptidase domain-containing ABC transporter [Actinomycetota bacterium]